MTSQQLGSSFEIITRDFFVWLFEKIGFTVTKARAQKSGNQHGFDILITITKDFEERKVFIECKNYQTDLSIGNIYRKALSLEANYELDEGDLFIAINPRSNFSNEDNSEKLSPVLDQKLKCTYYALDLSNGVKELFALNNSFYRILYEKDIDFPINEQKELDRFKSIIYSRKPFKKIVLQESDKSRFIGDIQISGNIIERYFIEDERNSNSSFEKEKKHSLTLSDILEREDKIFIIGSPGTGKSTELKKFALQNWQTGENENFVPIFKSLKNFTNTDHISDYLPTGWEKLNKVFFILDGIDEISDIEYFKSKLENFISQNAESRKKSKFIISCRANVYESIIKGIKDFNVYYLRDLYSYESLEFLKNNYGAAMDSLYYSSAYNSFLKTPFQLEILADFIKNKKQIPSNMTALWEQYINSRLSHDKNDKLKKAALNIPALKKWSMKLSLINELMKTNVIGDEDLYTILGESSREYEDFKKNPLLDIIPNQEKYFFEHRNIQEYFAAAALSRFSSDKIKDFLIIDNVTNKTHPSLFNTITFLINIADDQQFNDLVEWFAHNEPELLFKADSDRSERYKKQVFQNYFNTQCVAKTFWISGSKTFTTKEIAEFGDCHDNFDYLLTFITSCDDHFRVKISALELLSHFTVPADKKEKLKNTLYKGLENSENSEMIKSHILECIHDLKLCEDDDSLLDQIFGLFKDETSKQINRAILSFIEEYEDADRFFWFIKHEFLLDRGLVPRKTADEVIRGTSWILERLLLRFNLPDHFIDLAKHYFDEADDTYVDRKYMEEIIVRCRYFESQDSTFLVKLFVTFQSIKDYYFREHEVKDLILKSSISSRQKLFIYLTEKTDFKVTGYFLASITDQETICIVIDKFADGTIESSNLDFFRNVLGNTKDRKLAEYFNQTMTEKGFMFAEVYLSQDQLDTLTAKSRRRPQENFDLLFDTKLLLSKIQIIFERYGKIINPAMIRQINNDWYKENGGAAKMEISYAILARIVHKFKMDLKYTDLERILMEDHLLIINEIKAQIQLQNNANIFFKINNVHMEFLFKWCLKAADEIDFENIITIVNSKTINLLGDFHKLKAVLYFATKFDFELPQEFLLNSIEYIDINRTSAQDGNLNELLDRIKNRDDANSTIVRNLLHRNLYSLAVNSHIQYALDHNIQQAFSKIAAYLKDKNYSFNIERVLKQYIKLTDDTALLSHLCHDIKSHKCWCSLKLLMELGLEPDLCRHKAILYLGIAKEDQNQYSSSALSILFELKSTDALYYLLEHLDSENLPSLKEISYTGYDVIDAYQTLHKLYEKIYIKNEDKFGLSDMRNFMSAYVANLSKHKNQYLQVQHELELIKTNLGRFSENKELFYINHLLDDSKKGYVNSQSKTFCFKDALSKAEEIFK